jgi:hypothetical protein
MLKEKSLVDFIDNKEHFPICQGFAEDLNS